MMIFGSHSNRVNTRREKRIGRPGHGPFISQDEKEQRKNVFLVRCIEVWNFPSRRAMGAPLFEPFSTTLDQGRKNVPEGSGQTQPGQGGDLMKLPQLYLSAAHYSRALCPPGHLLPCPPSNPIIGIARQQQKYTLALSKYVRLLESPSDGFLFAKYFMCYWDDGKSSFVTSTW